MIDDDRLRWILAAVLSTFFGTAMYPSTSDEYSIVHAERDQAHAKEWVIEYTDEHCVSRVEMGAKIDILSERMITVLEAISEIKADIRSL